MGFLLQLRVLLWKNLTLKRRNPWVLGFELFIPLVLFVILLAIRKKQPASPINAVRFNAQPLPSAGVIATMQAFCTGGTRDQYGFIHYENNTVPEFLERLNDVAHNNNFFKPDFSPQDLDKLPAIYRSIIDDPAAIHDVFSHAKDFELDSILKKNVSLENLLVKNFSLPQVDVDVLLHSNINVSEVYRLMFGLDEDMHMRWSHRQKRAASPELTPDLALLPYLASLVPHSLQDASEHQLYKYLTDKGGTISPVMLEKLSHLMPDMITPVQIVAFIEKLVLSPDSLHKFMCNRDAFMKLFVPPTPNDTVVLESTQVALCNLTTMQLEELSQTLIADINTSRIVEIFNLENMNITKTIWKLVEFVKNVKEFMLFEKNLQQLSMLASKMPQDACAIGPLGNITVMNQTKPGKDADPYSKNKYTGLLKIWLGMQKTLCGHQTHIDEKKLQKFAENMDPSILGLNNEQKQDLMILVHALYSNMRVLYAPNATQVDNVIAKANSTFMLLDTVSMYAKKWLNVSAQIREYLELNNTAENIRSIQRMQYDLQSIPTLRRLAHLLGLDEFVYNTTVPDDAFFIHQLDEVDIAACSWLSLINGVNLNVFRGFASEEDAVDYFLHTAYGENVSVLATVVFTNLHPNGTLPPHVVYKIRQNATFTESTKFVRARYWYPGPNRWHTTYYKFGFVWIQDVIERAIVDTQVGRDVIEPGSYINEFPYPCYMSDQFLFIIEHVMPLCLTVSWVYTVAMLVQSIVHEKENRLKEVMKMMGLSNSVHWLAWFITTFSQMTITTGILTCLLKYGQVLNHSNPWIIFLVLEIFTIATISFSFLISVLYSKAKLAAACAGIVYFLGYVPCMYVAIREEAAGDTIPGWTKTLASLFSTTSFGLGAKYFGFYEIEGVGVQWDNMYKSPVENDEYNLFWSTIMMTVDALLYGLLTWYIENIHPGSYGLPKPWYFPFTKSYWTNGIVKTESQQCSWRKCFKRRTELSVMEEGQAGAMAQDQADDENKFEVEPTHLPLGVCIEDLTKVYKTGKLAVNKLSLNLYEGQITSFLGHNGAGKTTTMSILTGLFPPTSGSATIYGNNIRTNMEEIRKSLGMCPQHNVLFDKLTVEEHLWFYATLKGSSAQAMEEEMESMIKDIGLPKKRNNTVDSLSGGMKRKLSVAIAFVAGSQTVILDEPTAGVDPYARRAIWDLLLKYKQDRTILLSTHHMDEADLLGDRIAIISHGQLKCCGSSLYLKSTFGEGYHLTLVKKLCEEDIQSNADTLSITSQTAPGAMMPTSHCSEPKVTRFVQRHLPSAYLKSETGQELQYILPFEAAKKGQFEKLFDALDSNLKELDLATYGLMDTNLEEVFLKVTERARKNSTDDNEGDKAEKENKDASEAQQSNVPESSNTAEFQPGHNRVASDASILSNIVFGPGPDVELNNVAAMGHHRTPSNTSNLSDLIHLEGAAAMPIPGSKPSPLRLPSTCSYMSDIMMNSVDVKMEQFDAANLARKQEYEAVQGAECLQAGNESLLNTNASSPSRSKHFYSRQVSLDDVPLLTDHRTTEPGFTGPLSGGNSRTFRGHRRNASDVGILSDVGNARTPLVNPSVNALTSPRSSRSFTPSHQRSPSDGSLLANLLLGRKEFVPGHNRNTSNVSVQSCNGAEIPGAQRRRFGKGPKYTKLESTSASPKKDSPDILLEGRGSYVVSGYSLLLQQFWGVILKRFAYTTRNWKGLFSQILLPALFVCVAMTVALSAPRIKDLPPIVLSPAQYYNNTKPRGNFIPHTISKDIHLPEWKKDAPPDNLTRALRYVCGMGPTCLLNAPSYNVSKFAGVTRYDFMGEGRNRLLRYFQEDCQNVFTSEVQAPGYIPSPPRGVLPTIPANNTEWKTLKPSVKIPRYYPECQCSADRAGFVCQTGGYEKPPSFKTVTGDILQNIRGQEEEDFYLNTNSEYRLHRYGAMSFGNVRSEVPENFGNDAPTLFRKLAVRNVAKSWYNNKGFHAMPVYINTLNNVILRANLPKEKGNPSAYGITAINHPMNNTNNHLSMEYILQGSDVLIAIFVIVAMSFVPASFVLFLVYEKSIKAKHLQFVCGINRVVYWLANYVWDMANYLIPMTCCILILRVFDIPAYVSSTNFPAVMALFLMYGWSITPMMYPASFVFKEPSTAYIALIVANLFIGITCIVTSFLLEMFRNDKELAKVHEILKNIFILFPNYCLGRGLMDIAFNEYENQYFFRIGQYNKMKSPLTWEISARSLVAMAGIGLFFFLITLLCEFSFFIKPKRTHINPLGSRRDEDSDVAHERKRVLRGSGRRDMLRLENLTKIYKTRKLGNHLAVDRLCLGVPEGECFGLLGVNGAGKTTTFKMLTGDLPPTGGDAFLNNHSILKDMLKVQQKIGYCPQFDALYDELTAREHLMLYARLRGIPCGEQKRVVDWALDKLGLTEYANKLSGTYSGGNKRKLSTAIALIGHPPVIFLDEPTTGMDPHSRRFLWDLILNLIKGGRSVILTSHSMEECEALCTRLAIMVNGKFKCLGSIQHLKSRYGDGYTVSVRVKGPNYERQIQLVQRHIERHYPQARVKEAHHNMVQYELPSQDLSLSGLFAKMEDLQNDLEVEDYSISQNTLDNVFINFVKQQTEIVREHELSPEHTVNPRQRSTSLSSEDEPLLQAGSLETDDSDDITLQIERAGGRLTFQQMDVVDC